MSTLRQDPTSAQWVILAPGRTGRPHQVTTRERSAPLPYDPSCPFCAGNEEQTPPEILRVPDAGGWAVRVVPNLYAVLGDGTMEPPEDGPFREMPGIGSHEIAIESPAHDATLASMVPGDVVRVVAVWRVRYRALLGRPEVRAVVVFKNHGPLAGTSLAHPHSQIVATPVFLPRLHRRLEVATRYFNDHGSCVYDDLLTAELGARDRIVYANPSFVALAPFAAASAFETWIVPRRHGPSFGGIRDEEMPDLADALVEVTRRLSTACNDPDWNLVVYSAPGEDLEGPFHWHIKVVPRLTTPAGFELGSGMGINLVPPEEAAAAMRASS